MVQLLSQPPILTEVRAADELILDDLRSRAQFQGSLDPLLSQYIVKLRERERYLQANQAIVADLQAQLAASEAQGASLQLEKDQLTRESQNFDQNSPLPIGGKALPSDRITHGPVHPSQTREANTGENRLLKE